MGVATRLEIEPPKCIPRNGIARERNKELIKKPTLVAFGEQGGRDTSLYPFASLEYFYLVHQLFLFKNCLNKSFGFGRLRGESGAEGNLMDSISKGLIPGQPFRQKSRTASD